MEGRERLLKMQRTLRPDALLKSYGLPTWEELAKDAGDDSGDDEDDDSGNGDGGDDDASDGFGDGNSHYNPDEPRIPTGQPGAGQWTTAGNGTSTDSGSISADDIRSTLIDGFNNPSPLPQGTETAANNTVQSDASPADNSADNKQSATGTLVRLDNLPLENSRILPYFDASIANQIYSFFEDAENQGIPLMMTSGFRTSVTQSNLTGNQYGGAAAGSSLHEAGFAFDINWQDLTSEEQEQILDIAADNDLE